jgi:hypothetical protein
VVGATTNIAGGIGNLATGAANSNASLGNNIGTTMQGVGQAQASGTVGGVNAITSAIGSGTSNSLLAQYIANQNPSAYLGNKSAVGAGTDTQYNQWALGNGFSPSDL